nr:hypothetical protein [uncultured Arsenicibacter sp.]
MAYTIHQRHEHKRGCGYRKKGGFYFFCESGGKTCMKLPIQVSVCPCCGEGIQQTRGFKIVSSLLIDNTPCKKAGCQISECRPFGIQKQYYLMWVGEKFYKTPAFFLDEAKRMGISKRLPEVPKNFVVGTDWVLLAHPKTPFQDDSANMEFLPGIFAAFCPDRIEYVVRGNESAEKLQSMADRGITLIDVHPIQEEQPKTLFEDAAV